MANMNVYRCQNCGAREYSLLSKDNSITPCPYCGKDEVKLVGYIEDPSECLPSIKNKNVFDAIKALEDRLSYLNALVKRSMTRGEAYRINEHISTIRQMLVLLKDLQRAFSFFSVQLSEPMDATADKEDLERWVPHE